MTMISRCFKFRRQCTWISAVVILSVLWSGTDMASASGDPEKGKNLFRESCQHCHGFAGKGDGEMAAYLTPPPSNLWSDATQAKSNKELKAVILKGREGTAMAGFEGAVDERQLNDLLAYLRSLKS